LASKSSGSSGDAVRLQLAEAIDQGEERKVGGDAVQMNPTAADARDLDHPLLDDPQATNVIALSLNG
jgi:hypothetical protein